MKRALITGITGMDGSHLADLLLEKGYEVHGLVRPGSTLRTQNIQHLLEPERKIQIHYADLIDSSSLFRVLEATIPDEIYHLGAQAHVRVSFDLPEYTADVTALGTLRVLEAMRSLGLKSKFYQASSSELYGGRPGMIDESVAFHPRSPYACAKAFAYHTAVNHREAYGVFAVNGILFNHEGPRRSQHYVTRKVTLSVARIAAGKQKELRLGNLDAFRDWGYAPEYCIPKETPILTPSGWKEFEALAPGDEVINFDPASSSMRRDTVREKIEIRTAGRWVVLRGRGVHLRVTPDHRIIYQSKSKKSKGGWSKWKFSTAEDFARRLQDQGHSTKYGYRLPHFQDYDGPDAPYTDHQIRVVGYLLTEGCLRQTLRKFYASISQSTVANERVAADMRNDLLSLGYTFGEQLRDTGLVEYCLSADSTRDLIEGLFDGFNVHVMPRWCFSLSARQAQILVNAMMDCDGSWDAMTYTSKRPKLAVDFQTIAHLAGLRTTGVRRIQSGMFYVGLVSARRKHPYVLDAEVEEGPDAEAWCVRTDHGTIITRQEGCIVVSGNCEGMWRMLQADQPDDYILATGQTHSVRELVELAFDRISITNWEKYVRFDDRFLRPSEVDRLQGDPSKARDRLGWEPKITFRELVALMVEADMRGQGFWGG